MNFRQKKQEVVVSFCLCVTYFALGLGLAYPGPMLLDLQELTDTSVHQISWIFVVRSLAYFVSVLLVGFVLKEKFVLWRFASSYVLLTASISSVGWCTNYGAILCIFAVQGVCMGTIETTGCMLCLALWGDDHAPFLQAMYSMWIFGCFAAPILATPFLKTNSNAIGHNSTEGGRNESTINRGESIDIDGIVVTNDSLEKRYRTVQNVSLPALAVSDDSFLSGLQLSFVIIGAFTLLVGAFMCASYLFYHQRHIEKSKAKEQELALEKANRRASESAADCARNRAAKRKRKKFEYAVIALTSFCVYFLIAMETNFGEFLPAFIVKNFNRSKSDGNVVMSTYWGTYALASALAICLVRHLQPHQLLRFNLAIILAAMLTLTVGGADNYYVVLVTCAVLGVGQSTTFAALFSWADFHIQKASRVTTALVSMATLGEMCAPLVTGLFFERNPRSFLFFSLVCAVMGVVLYVLCEIIAHFNERRLAGEERQQTTPMVAADAQTDAEKKDGEADVHRVLVTISPTISRRSDYTSNRSLMMLSTSINKGYLSPMIGKKDLSSSHTFLPSHVAAKSSHSQPLCPHHRKMSISHSAIPDTSNHVELSKMPASSSFSKAFLFGCGKPAAPQHSTANGLSPQPNDSIREDSESTMPVEVIVSTHRNGDLGSAISHVGSPSTLSL
ncbi:sodium-dependent glucose transporter 1A-like [Tubulanus polymorphus]|uniref:sodium-dependent glucose transporter 1A-like n=1 Tax=Tubulanus polymorphus TaxID=672921 RepID=UPI003DA6A725